MAIQVESDLKDILIKFDQKLDKLAETFEQKLDHLQSDMNEVKISIAELKKDNQRLEDKIEATDKKIDATAKSLEDKIENTDKKIDSTAKGLEDKIDALNKNLSDNVQNLSKRVDNSDFINRGIFISLVITILGGFASFLGLIGKP